MTDNQTKKSKNKKAETVYFTAETTNEIPNSDIKCKCCGNFMGWANNKGLCREQRTNN
jgi:hypothetical protein